MGLPYSPYRIPDTMPIEERLAVLRQSILEDGDRQSVRTLARQAYAMAKDVSPRTLAAAALARVQRLPYRPDPPGEWFQSPAYTALYGGDCEDLATLYVAVCALLGLDARLVWITQKNQALNHVTAVVVWDPAWPGVLEAPGWEWSDASMLGARLGENPYDAVKRLDLYHVIGGRV